MPELPEVETIRAGLAGRFSDPRLETIRVRERRLRIPVPVAALEELRGARIGSFGRRAKYLLLPTERGRTIVLHLGMSGRVLVVASGVAAERHDHVLFGLRDDGEEPVELRLRDPRRFGLVDVVDTDRLGAHRLFAHLGPEPLGEEFTADYLAARADGRRAPVKSFLMDARIVVGVGNIYASEALWRAGIHPTRAAGRIARKRLEGLREAVRGVLVDAIGAGGTTLRDFRDSNGNLGYFAIELEAYDREGSPCRRCGEPIRRIVQVGRATYYCAGCQR